MGVLYLAALIIGGGAIALQLLLGSDGHADAGAHTGGAGDHGEAGVVPIFLSLRFWTFGLLGFGMVGTALHHLGLAGRLPSLASAIVIGLISGFGASWAFRALVRADTSSGAHADDPIGHVGRVLVACRRGGHGKVRIELRGQTLDLLATTDEDELASGTEVLIEEVRGTTAHVSRVPPEMLPPKQD